MRARTRVGESEESKREREKKEATESRESVVGGSASAISSRGAGPLRLSYRSGLLASECDLKRSPRERLSERAGVESSRARHERERAGEGTALNRRRRRPSSTIHRGPLILACKHLGDLSLFQNACQGRRVSERTQKEVSIDVPSDSERGQSSEKGGTGKKKERERCDFTGRPRARGNEKKTSSLSSLSPPFFPFFSLFLSSHLAFSHRKKKI